MAFLCARLWRVDFVTRRVCDELTGDELTVWRNGLRRFRYMTVSVQRGGHFRYMTTSVHTTSISVHVFFAVRLRYMRSTISVQHYVDIGTLQENVNLLCWRSQKCPVDVMLRSFQVVNSCSRVHDRWKRVPFMSWARELVITTGELELGSCTSSSRWAWLRGMTSYNSR